MTHGDFRTEGWRRWGAGAQTAVGSAPTAVSKTKPTNMIETETWRGGRFMVFGDTDDDVCNLEFYTVERNYVLGAKPKSGTAPVVREPVYISRLFCDVDTIAIGQQTGVDSFPRLVDTAELLAQTYTTLTVAGAYGEKVLAMNNGSADVFSPGSDGIGEIFISDFGDCLGVVPVFDTMVSGANYFGLLFRLSL